MIPGNRAGERERDVEVVSREHIKLISGVRVGQEHCPKAAPSGDTESRLSACALWACPGWRLLGTDIPSCAHSGALVLACGEFQVCVQVSAVWISEPEAPAEGNRVALFSTVHTAPDMLFGMY